jgi:hypothetical protein
MKIYKSIFLLFILTLPSYAQVTVILQQPPPLQFKLEHMWKVTLVNTTQTTYRVYLHGTATEQRNGVIADANTGLFSLPPGTKMVTATDLNPITVNDANKTYKEVVNKTGSVPTGNYDICVEAIDEATGLRLGNTCIEHEVLNVSQLSLLFPADNEQVGVISDEIQKEKTGKAGLTDEESLEEMADEKPRPILLQPPPSAISSIITFAWSPPVPVQSNQTLRYKIKIVELFIKQTGYDAMQSNPLFYSTENIASTLYQFPIAARPFKAGKKYAWQVDAYVNGVLMSQSEIWTFSIGETNDVKNERTKKKKYGMLNDREIASSLRSSQIINSPLFEKSIDNFMGQTGASGLKLQNIKEVETTPFCSPFTKGEFSQKPIQFNFSTKLTAENSNRSGTGSDIEQRYLTWELTPSVSLWGIPYSTTLLLSTENSAARQNVNFFDFDLDLDKVKEMVEDKVKAKLETMKDEIEQKVKEKGEKYRDKIESEAKDKAGSVIKGPLKWFSYFNTLGIGTTYPDYTPLTVKSIPVTGVNIEFNPGWFYIAVAALKSQKPVENSAFKRNVYAGRLGVGKKEKSHFFFTGLFVKDDPNSIKVDSTNLTLTPNSNYLFGMEGKLNLFKDKLTFEGEIAGSLLTRDNRDADLVNKAIPSWVTNMFHPKISSQIDYSYTVKSIFNNEKSKTKLTAGVKMIGPGYKTLGNPTLGNDKLEVEGKLEQKFLENKISFSSTVKWFRDNLIPIKRSTTTNTFMSINLGLRPKGYPVINLIYIPLFQKNDQTNDTFKVDYKSQTLMGLASYTAMVQGNSISSLLSYTLNLVRAFGGVNDVTSHNVSLTETFSFKVPLSLTIGAGIIKSTESGLDRQTSLFTFNGSYTLMKFWTYGGGVSLEVEKDKSKKTIINLYTSFAPIKNLSFNINIDKNILKDWQTSINDYDEFIFRSEIGVNF